MRSFELLARRAYAAYCVKAGGKTFDDKPLPSFDELGAERQACWVAAVKQVVTDTAHVH